MTTDIRREFTRQLFAPDDERTDPETPRRPPGHVAKEGNHTDPVDAEKDLRTFVRNLFNTDD